MTTLPGLTADGGWDLPSDLNMAAQCLVHSPEALAVIDLTSGTRRDVHFGDLSEMVDRLAAVLLKNSVAPGDRVGVLLSQTPWCVASHLAIWKIGAISVPLFKLFERQALQTRIEDASLQIVLTDEEGSLQIDTLARPVIAEAAALQTLEGDFANIPFARTGPETPAILIYTSGTTGAPKGALHGHRILTGHLPGVALSHNHLGAEGDVLWTPADWAWIGGLFDVALTGLALGVPVVAVRLEKFSADACVQICKTANVRNVFLPPTALRILRAADVTIPGLRSVACGGEPLGPEMLAWGQQAFGVTINEFYGQTECNMVASSCANDFAPRPGALGKTVPGFDLAVLDEEGQKTNLEGNIAVRKGAASMMLGYWQKPEATVDAFCEDWLLTGDRGVWEGDFLRFVGRSDDVITSAGYRIGPSEIEDCLLAHPSVATVGVVGKPDVLRTQIVKAYVVCKKGHAPTVRDLQSYVKSRLARHSYPREIEFVSALPMTVTGKVIRKALKAKAAAEAARGT